MVKKTILAFLIILLGFIVYFEYEVKHNELEEIREEINNLKFQKGYEEFVIDDSLKEVR